MYAMYYYISMTWHFTVYSMKYGYGCVVLCFSYSSLSSMLTSSNGNIFRVTGRICGEFTGHRWIPLIKASNAELWSFFFDLHPNKRLSEQSRRWWFETPYSSLWRHCNIMVCMWFICLPISSMFASLVQSHVCTSAGELNPGGHR